MGFTYADRKAVRAVSQRRAEPSAGSSAVSLRSGAAPSGAGQLGRRVDLPEAMRAKMESAFGADLSAVKLYESEAVGEAGADAVTRGANVAFAPGLLDFTSFGGQALLGHELSHVVSQARGEVSGGGFLNDAALEARADREGAMAAAGQTVAMPSAALADASAASAAGPMQAKKTQEPTREETMTESMASSGFTEEQMEAARYFDSLNRTRGAAGAEEMARADELASTLTEQNLQPVRDEAALQNAWRISMDMGADEGDDFLTGQMRIGAHHNTAAAAKQLQGSLRSDRYWGYRPKRDVDAAEGYTDAIIDAASQKEAAALASETATLKSENFSGTIKGGKLNQVYEFGRGREKTDAGGYFKPASEDYLDSTAIMHSVGIRHDRSGKTSAMDPRLTNREIAYSVLGKLLGSTVTLEARQAKVEDGDLTGKHYKDGREVPADTEDAKEYGLKADDTGALLETARGGDWEQYNWQFYGPETGMSSDEAMDRDKILASKTEREKLSPEKLAQLEQDAAVANTLRAVGDQKTASVGERLAAVPGAKIVKQTTNFGEKTLAKARSDPSNRKRYSKEALDASDANLQREMNEMFLLDTLSGHTDRHDNNFMLEKKEDGSLGVKAIDNDLTFGEDLTYFGQHTGHYSGLPERMHIDANMAAKIQGMKKETLETAMGHLLSREEIDALWQKFQMLSAYIEDMRKQDLVVDKWDEDTARREFELAGGVNAYRMSDPADKKREKTYSGNSYYQRMILKLNGRMRGVNVDNSKV